MKKLISATLLTIMLLSAPLETFAKTLPVNRIGTTTSDEIVIYQDTDFIITESQTVEYPINALQTFSTAKGQKSLVRTYSIKSSTGAVLATFTLKATFTYTGKTATCTNSSCSTQIKKNNVSFTSKSASKSGSTATGKYSLKIKNTGKTITNSVTIKCDKNGNIS